MSKELDYQSPSLQKEAIFPALGAGALMAARFLAPMAIRAVAPTAARLIGGAAARGGARALLQGGARGMAKNLLGTAGRSAITQGLGAVLNQAGASGADGPDYSMAQPAVGQPVAQPTAKTAVYGEGVNHPSTVNKRDEDPENGKLFPSTRTQDVNGPLGDQEWQRDYTGVNPIGESSPSTLLHKEDQTKRILTNYDDSEIIEKAIVDLFENLPKILEFFESEESGEDDEDIKRIHDTFESIFPGFMDMDMTPEAEELLMIIDDERNNSKKIKKSNADAQNAVFCMIPNCNKPVSPDLMKQGKPALCEGHASEQSAAGKQGPDASPYSVNSLTQEWVPVNEMQQVNNMLRQFTGSDTQGPHTDEQQAAVAEMLIEQGREGEIPAMLQNPADYDEELAEIQNKDPLLGEDPEDVGMGAQDQMAQMGMGPDAGGMPAGPPMGGEMPPGPPGAAPGIPDMSAPTPADLNPAGPGAMPPPVMASVTSSMLEAAFKYGADNVAGKCPKCDSHTTKMVQQDGKSKCHTCHHEWQDETFQKSDGDSSHSTTTSSFYAAMDSFVDEDVEEEIIDDSSHTWTDEDNEPLEEGKEYEIYAHNYKIPEIGRVVELKPDAVVYEIESDGGIRREIEIDRQEADLNGYRFAPTAANSDENLDDGTFGIEDKIAPEPGQTTDLSTPHREIGASAKEATVTYYMCPVADCPNNQGGGDYEPGTCSIHNKELVPAGQEKSAHKTAGKHYTPMEQRELIDEYGQARNADKLNLEGTHYATAEDDYFLFGCQKTYKN